MKAEIGITLHMHPDEAEDLIKAATEVLRHMKVAEHLELRALVVLSDVLADLVPIAEDEDVEA